MCVPCKEVINNGAVQAAQTMSLIRELLVRQKRGEFNDVTDFPVEGGLDDELYELAVAEVEFIESCRAACRRLAKQCGADERWVKLMERL